MDTNKHEFGIRIPPRPLRLIPFWFTAGDAEFFAEARREEPTVAFTSFYLSVHSFPFVPIRDFKLPCPVHFQ